MTNALYHSFTPGFNWWYVVAVVFIAAQAGIGWLKYGFDERIPAIMPRLGSKLRQTVSACCFTLIILGMMLQESGTGVVQYFDNQLAPYESGVYSLVLAVLALNAVAVLYFVLLCGVGVIAGHAKYGYLAQKKRQINRRRYRAEREYSSIEADPDNETTQDDDFLAIQRIFKEVEPRALAERKAEATEAISEETVFQDGWRERQMTFSPNPFASDIKEAGDAFERKVAEIFGE